MLQNIYLIADSFENFLQRLAEAGRDRYSATMRGEARPSPRAGFADFVLRILDPNPPPQDAPPAKVEGLVC